MRHGYVGGCCVESHCISVSCHCASGCVPSVLWPLPCMRTMQLHMLMRRWAHVPPSHARECGVWLHMNCMHWCNFCDATSGVCCMHILGNASGASTVLHIFHNSSSVGECRRPCECDAPHVAGFFTLVLHTFLSSFPVETQLRMTGPGISPLHKVLVA